MDEINAVASRWQDEREQETMVGLPTDRLDEALAEDALRVDDAIVRENVQDVRDITAARKRQSEGQYGLCVDCGDDIDYTRRLAYPTAKRCIDWQRLHEQQKPATDGPQVPSGSRR